MDRDLLEWETDWVKTVGFELGWVTDWVLGSVFPCGLGCEWVSLLRCGLGLTHGFWRTYLGVKILPKEVITTKSKCYKPLHKGAIQGGVLA